MNHILVVVYLAAMLFSPARQQPTWAELNLFLAQDHINWLVYNDANPDPRNPDFRNCVIFSRLLIDAMEIEGYDAWMIGVKWEYRPIGHAFVAVRTSDKGIVWIEPQTDYAYRKANPGERLCLQSDTSKCWPFGLLDRVDELDRPDLYGR